MVPDSRVNFDIGASSPKSGTVGPVGGDRPAVAVKVTVIFDYYSDAVTAVTSCFVLILPASLNSCIKEYGSTPMQIVIFHVFWLCFLSISPFILYTLPYCRTLFNNSLLFSSKESALEVMVVSVMVSPWEVLASWTTPSAATP